MQTSATPMAYGRYGSNATRFEIHAPLIPTVTNTNGPRQQTEATIAASAPPIRDAFSKLPFAIGKSPKLVVPVTWMPYRGTGSSRHSPGCRPCRKSRQSNSNCRTTVRSQGVEFMDRNLTIGRLARAAGVNVETVRYYQRRGLVAEPERPLNSVRRYSEDSVKRIRFIKRAQELGFTLAETANLLALEDGRSCRETRELAGRKLAIVESRLTDLNRLRKTLRELIARCDTSRGKVSCPIISVLSSERS